MELTGLTQTLRDSRAYRQLLARLQQGEALHTNLIRAARPFVLAALAADWPAPVVVITPQVKRAYNISEQLPVWTGADDAGVFNYAEPTAQFYERTPWVESVIRSRAETLAALMPPAGVDQTEAALVVASARALLQRTIPGSTFRQRSQVLKPGQRWSIDRLLSEWLGLGYEPVSLVMEPGTFSRRGGVIDVYPVAAEQPVRLDFFDDEIDTLRTFDASTQRSETGVNAVAITPAREALPVFAAQVGAHLADWFATLPPAEADMTAASADADPLASGAAFPYLEHYLPYMYPNPVSLLDYAPVDALVIVEDMDDLREMVDGIGTQAARTRDDLIAAGQLPPDFPRPHLSADELWSSLAERRVLCMGLEAVDDVPLLAEFGARFAPGKRFGGQLRPMLTDLRQQRSEGDQTVVITQQSGRLTQLWYDQDASAFVPTVNDVTEPPADGALLFINGTLQEGWTFSPDERNGALHLLTDAEIYGWNRPEPRRRKTSQRRRTPESDYADWAEGDYVVHVDYGIGRFGGMRHRTVDGVEREYLLVEYGSNDLLYVPIHQADRLTRYIGAGDTPPTLNRLGQPEWIRTKNKARKAVEEEARELLALYAERTQARGHAYNPDTHWQHELEASFPFVETEDQLRALREVKADMETSMPMDRLICGDVGYGKTEVALRAAFKAVMDGKQVALLVPTTVLAQQHYETLSNRLAAFPVTVEVLSRFRTREEQQRTLPRIASGEVDIVIGTHRILSADITFKELGLVIIDEEQRFGVKHKEHFKKLRAQVDVLTLTATPIPRTLYMGLTGVRDISMIQTPPEERLPVITHAGKWDEKLVRQAILRELERGGQTFVVHNRIRTIDTVRDQLEEIVPEARVVSAHGQMPERVLEGVMAAFARGEYDVLLSTAIIESGIDIPNANTLIVDRSDWFGMAQLYQLRGRVGRSAQQAYAYFFHPRKLTEEARSRLETLAENTTLGAGFQIAVRDLEMRGAGDILSTRQTGHVAAVGLHLYTQLLSQAVQRQKGETPPVTSAATETAGIVIDLPLAAYLPGDWIPEMALRLQIYRRIAGLSSQAEIDAMRDELLDRFGQLPIAVDGLLYQIEVKLLAQAAAATHILARGQQVQVKLPYLGEVDRLALEQRLGDDVTVSRVAVTLPLDDDQLWKLRLLDVLGALAAGVQATYGR